MVRRLNLACGLQVPDDWENCDTAWPWDTQMADRMILAKQYRFRLGNMATRYGLPYTDGAFDEVYVGHALHLFTLHEIQHQVMPEIQRVLTKGGLLRIAEMDVAKAFAAYQIGDADWFPMPAETTLDGKLCRFLTWHSTRRTLFTRSYMCEILWRCGFNDCKVYPAGESPLDQRPSESFYVKATR